MVAALILVISTAMLAQFLIFFWHANMLAVAAQPISESLSSAQANFSIAVNLEDFDSVAAMSKLCTGVTLPPAKLWPVRAYYQAMRALLRSSAWIPQANLWARQEMALCTRYVAVSMDRCLQSNQAYAAALRSY
jgi:hypothetical protein